MLEHRAAHRGRQRRDVVVGCGLGSCGAGSGACRSPRSAGVSPAPAGFVVARRRPARASPQRRGRTLVDRRDHRADRDRVAFLDQLLAQHAGDRRGHLDRDLVGLEAGDRLVGRDRRRRASSATAPSVPSVIDSPSAGTLTSVAIVIPSICATRAASGAAAMAERRGDQAPPARLRGAWRGRSRARRWRRGRHIADACRRARFGEAASRAAARRRTRRRCSSALPAPRPPPRGSASRFRRLTSGSDGERIELLDPDDLGRPCRRPRRALPSARRRPCPSTAPGAASRLRRAGSGRTGCAGSGFRR